MQNIKLNVLRLGMILSLFAVEMIAIKIHNILPEYFKLCGAALFVIVIGVVVAIPFIDAIERHLTKRALDDANVERHGQTTTDDRIYSDNATGATPHRK